MGLSPVLFVGLGGTGGKVLGAVRHHLLRELNNAGVREIPQGWQFLHIDVPAERDAEEEGKPFTLPQDAYRPLTGVGDSYSGAYGQLSAALPPDPHHPDEQRHVAWTSWAPAPPEQVPAHIDKGAGQLRAVGRVAALTALPQIVHAIASADQKLRLTANGLFETGVALGAPDPRVTGRPAVFVVASMNGGSGSGILIEVCDLLRLHGFPQPIALLFTPDVMTGTTAQGDPGLAPNAYLLMHEILAAQWSALPEDTPTSRAVIHRAMHTNVGGAKGGPDAIALVGRRNQSLALPDGPAVYGALARMLAEMTVDDSFLERFVDFVLVNRKPPAIDHLGLQVGQNAGNGEAVTLGMGFSRLTLGRDFFAQYARDRLLRACAVQLLEAHLNTGGGVTSVQPDQLLQDAADLAFPTFLEALRLREFGHDAATMQPHDDLLDAISTLKTPSGRDRVERVKSSAQEAMRAQAKHGFFGSATIATIDAGQAAAQCVTDSTQAPRPGATTANLLMEAVAEAVQRVGGLRKDLSERMARVVVEKVARRGIPVTIRLLSLLGEHLRQAAGELREEAEFKVRESRSLLDALRAGEGYGRRSFALNEHAVLSHLAELAGDAFAGLVRGHEMQLTADIAEQIAHQLVHPWQEALRIAREHLEQQVRPARKPEKPLDNWPQADAVPAAYRPTSIDHVLDDVDAFPETLEELTLARLHSGPVNDVDRPRIRRESFEYAVEEILKGEKVAQGTDRVAVARYLRQWVPDTGGSETPSPASVQVLFSEDDLRDRIERWLRYPQSATKAHLDMKLRDHLLCTDRPNDVALQQRRASAFVAQFNAWLRSMAPLLRFSSSLLTQVHGHQQPLLEPVIGSLDVPIQLKALRADLDGILGQLYPNAQPLSFDGQPRQAATAFTFTKELFHPLVCEDVMDPIAAKANPDWLHRRARPLAESVPLTPEARRALVTGWYAGRLLGVAELTGSAEQIRARVRVGKQWLTIPYLGIRRGRPQVQYDAPGRIVESLHVALLEAYRAHTLQPLEPYRLLIRLGEGVITSTGELHGWVMKGGGLNPSDDPLHLDATLSELKAREEHLLEKLKTLETGTMHGLTAARDETDEAYAQWWATREIEPDVRHAFDALRSMSFVTPPQA